MAARGADGAGGPSCSGLSGPDVWRSGDWRRWGEAETYGPGWHAGSYERPRGIDIREAGRANLRAYLSDADGGRSQRAMRAFALRAGRPTALVKSTGTTILLSQ